jgi:hypothetical protein
MLVPYVPPGSNQRTTGATFADYLRRGGHIQPVRLGASAQFGATEDEESVPLFRRGTQDSDPIRGLSKEVRSMSNRFRACACVASIATMILLSTLTFVGITAMNAANSVSHAIQPHASRIVDTTVHMMDDMGGTFTNLKDISRMTSELAQVNMGPGGTADRALNNSAAILQRLATLLEHPTIKVSLGT